MLHSNLSGSWLLVVGGLLCFLCEWPICYIWVWPVQLKCQCMPIMPILVKSPANNTTLWLWHIWILCTPDPIVQNIRRTWYKSYGERPIVHSRPNYAKYALSPNFDTIGLLWHKILYCRCVILTINREIVCLIITLLKRNIENQILIKSSTRVCSW